MDTNLISTNSHGEDVNTQIKICFAVSRSNPFNC